MIVFEPTQCTVNNYYNLLYSYKFNDDSMIDLAELFL